MGFPNLLISAVFIAFGFNLLNPQSCESTFISLTFMYKQAFKLSSTIIL